MPTTRDLRLTRAITDWFDAHGRDLPWRRRRTGYRALVAEAMLQQTQVARVVERYEAFLKRFPTVRALAGAHEDEVLAAWQGLGYYRRARLLHRAARAIVDEHGGRVPRTAALLRELPGVGRYTAGAIASIVHDEAAPIVDGNVVRVLSRVEGWDDDVGERERMAKSWQRTEDLVRAAPRPGAFNEGLMELGATVCTPRNPTCAACPLARSCRAKRLGRVHEIPPPKKFAARRVVHHHALVVERAGAMLFMQRPSSGLWARLWQPPTVEAEERLGEGELAATAPIRVSNVKHLETFEHLTSHRRVVFHVHRAQTRVRGGEWRTKDDLDGLALSNAHRRVIDAAGRGMKS